MPYTVGVSTGFWHIAKDPGLLGLGTKIAYGATTGVNFVQIDLESTAEFKEPELKYRVKRAIADLGIKEVGLHGEISNEHMTLDSALRRFWEDTHTRLCEALKGAKDLGLFYVNVHFSARPILLFEEDRYRIQGYFYPVVAPDGSALWTLCDRSRSAKELAIRYIQENILAEEMPKALNELIRKIYAERLRGLRRRAEEEISEDVRRIVEGTPELKVLPPQEKERIIRDEVKKRLEKKMPELEANAMGMAEREWRRATGDVYDMWKNSPYSKYLLTNSEIGAYEIVATYMQETNDPLWTKICGGDPRDAYDKRHAAYNAAVAAKYLEGHLLTLHQANKDNLDGLSIKDFCEKHRIYFLIEVPEGPQGLEGRYRLFDPRHAYHIVKKIRSPYMKMCIDTEHMLANKLDPDKVFDDLPADAGSLVHLWHLGKPIPYFGTAHIPIMLGSRAQEIIYKWMYKLKKKGMHKCYLLFERGGGQTTLEVYRESVLALRQVAEFLEKDIPPEELPPEFFGISPENKEVFARQLVAVRDHAFDPLTGLLQIPEETHTFLGRRAVELGKTEEWKKARYR